MVEGSAGGGAAAAVRRARAARRRRAATIAHAREEQADRWDSVLDGGSSPLASRCVGWRLTGSRSSGNRPARRTRKPPPSHRTRVDGAPPASVPSSMTRAVDAVEQRSRRRSDRAAEARRCGWRWSRSVARCARAATRSRACSGTRIASVASPALAGIGRAIGTTIESAAGHSAATASSPACRAIDAERERLLEVRDHHRQRLVVRSRPLTANTAATPRSSVGSTASA